MQQRDQSIDLRRVKDRRVLLHNIMLYFKLFNFICADCFHIYIFYFVLAADELKSNCYIPKDYEGFAQKCIMHFTNMLNTFSFTNAVLHAIILQPHIYIMYYYIHD